jgi:hypothetical protein
MTPLINKANPAPATQALVAGPSLNGLRWGAGHLPPRLVTCGWIGLALPATRR